MYGINPMGYPPQPIPQPQYQPPFLGQWRMVGSYQEALTIPLPTNGTPVLVMLQSEPTMYIMQMNGGERLISGYSFAPLPGTSATQEQAKEPTPTATAEIRMDRLERQLQQLCASLGEGTANESDISVLPK